MSLTRRGFAIALTVALVAGLAVVGYVAVRAGERSHARVALVVVGGDASAGRQALDAYGCGACHAIPGIRSARGRSAPDLAHLRERSYLAGRLPNTPEDLIRWIVEPQSVSPGTAMPNLGVTDDEARDMAAYLYGTRGRRR